MCFHTPAHKQLDPSEQGAQRINPHGTSARAIACILAGGATGTFRQALAQQVAIGDQVISVRSDDVWEIRDERDGKFWCEREETACTLGAWFSRSEFMTDDEYTATHP